MNDFTTGNPTKQIVSFAMPMLIGNIFQQLYSLADAMVVGRYVSGGALAAVGGASNLLNFLLSVLIGLATGASVVISQFYGARDNERLTRTVSTSLIFLSGFALVVTVIGIVGAPLFLRMLDTPENIMDEAVSYLRILMSSTVFIMLYNVYVAFLRALGDSKRPLYILIFSTVLNIILDILFVVGLGMGVNGAGLATIICQIIAAILCILYARHFVPLLHPEKLTFDPLLFRMVLRYSVPAAVQLSLTSLASLTIMRLVNSFGSSATAGFTAGNKMDQLVIMPASQVSMAVSTFVGQNMGADLEDRAKAGLRSAMKLMVGLSLFGSALVFIFGRTLVGLFVDTADGDAAAIIEIGTSYLSIIAIFYVLFAIFFAFNGFFRGVGDAVIVMIMTITSLTIRAVAAHILVHFFSMGPEAVAWSIPIGWFLCSLYSIYHYRARKWAGKVVVQKSAEA